jgi:hypothetical protein
LQRACVDAADAIADRFFDRQGTITWVTGR